MSLEHAILGFLSHRPLSGYDLKKRFDESVRYFWPATQSQIYRTLKRMVDDSWVSREVVEQDDHPDRKVHHITDEGLAELQRWLRTPLESPAVRSAWLIQVFFAHHLSNEEIIARFEERAERIRAQLEFLRDDVQPAIPRRFDEMHSERKRQLWQLTLDNGLCHMQGELDWTERAVESLRSLPED